jgi:hypothetical protein
MRPEYAQYFANHANGFLRYTAGPNITFNTSGGVGVRIIFPMQRIRNRARVILS